MQGDYKDIGNFGNTDIGEGSGLHLKSHDCRICGSPWVKDEWEKQRGVLTDELSLSLLSPSILYSRYGVLKCNKFGRKTKETLTGFYN